MSFINDIHESMGEEITDCIYREDSRALDLFNASNEDELARYRLYEIEGEVALELERIFLQMTKDAANRYIEDMRINYEEAFK